MQYWLLKSEPSSFSIDDLAKAKRKTTAWSGVRNYQARNFMRDQMRKDDLAFFYHSSCDEPGIVGIVSVASEAYPDATAFDQHDDHYDVDSDPSNPRWLLVDVQLQRKLKRPITLPMLRAHAMDNLSKLVILQRGNRLSITPVTKAEWQFILSLE
jgi:predicted RNA-binding protein with PUA-like domain